MPWHVYEELGPACSNARGLISSFVYVPKMSERQWTTLVQQWYAKGYIIYNQMCDLFLMETPCTVADMFGKQKEMVSLLPPPEIKTASYVSIYDLPDGKPFMMFSDIKLTYGDGFSLFTKEDILGELDRHEGYDLLYSYIFEKLPEDVLIQL